MFKLVLSRIHDFQVRETVVPDSMVEVMNLQPKVSGDGPTVTYRHSIAPHDNLMNAPNSPVGLVPDEIAEPNGQTLLDFEVRCARLPCALWGDSAAIYVRTLKNLWPQAGLRHQMEHDLRGPEQLTKHEPVKLAGEL